MEWGGGHVFFQRRPSLGLGRGCVYNNYNVHLALKKSFNLPSTQCETGTITLQMVHWLTSATTLNIKLFNKAPEAIGRFSSCNTVKIQFGSVKTDRPEIAVLPLNI